MIAWFNRDFWGPVWPNLAASGVCAVAAVLRIRVHLRRQHAVTWELVSGLHERLDVLDVKRKDTP